jgi:hypothetical protein
MALSTIMAIVPKFWGKTSVLVNLRVVIVMIVVAVAVDTVVIVF